MQDASNDQQINCDVCSIARMPNHRTGITFWPTPTSDDLFEKYLLPVPGTLSSKALEVMFPCRQNNGPIELEVESAI